MSSKYPWPLLKITVHNTSKRGHRFHLFSEPPVINGSVDGVFIQSFASAQIEPEQKFEFCIPRATWAVCAGGDCIFPQFPDFYGPITVASSHGNGTTINMTVNKQSGRAHFQPPATLTTTAAGAFSIETDKNFNQGDGYVVGIALPDFLHPDGPQLIVSTTEANPQARIQINQVLRFWICWADHVKMGVGQDPQDLIDKVTKAGTGVGRISFTGGNDSIDVSYMPNGDYSGEGVDMVPKPK